MVASSEEGHKSRQTSSNAPHAPERDLTEMWKAQHPVPTDGPRSRPSAGGNDPIRCGFMSRIRQGDCQPAPGSLTLWPMACCFAAQSEFDSRSTSRHSACNAQWTLEKERLSIKHQHGRQRTSWPHALTSWPHTWAARPHTCRRNSDMRRRRRLLGSSLFTRAIVTGLLLLPSLVSFAQQVTEPALKAAFIHKFARLTEWPDRCPAGRGASRHVCARRPRPRRCARAAGQGP